MGRCHRHLAVLMAFLAVSALAGPIATGPAVAADSGGDALTLSPDIPINSDASVGEYERNGVVSENISTPRMSVTIGEERDHVGLGMSLDPLDGSARNDFIKVTHSEELSRTVRIPISGDYWKPFPREELESMNGDHTATLEPVKLDGETYTMLTVTFDGQDSAVFPVPEDAVAVYNAAKRTENRTNSTFGVNLGLTPTPWDYIQPSVLSENDSSVRIEGNPDTMMLQYNAGTASDPVWLTVPESEKRNVPVYRMERDGVDNAVYVVSTTTDAPELRYKTQSSLGDRVSSWVRGAKHLPDRILDGLDISVDLPFMSLAVPVSVSTSEVVR